MKLESNQFGVAILWLEKTKSLKVSEYQMTEHWTLNNTNYFGRWKVNSHIKQNNVRLKMFHSATEKRCFFHHIFHSKSIPAVLWSQFSSKLFEWLLSFHSTFSLWPQSQNIYLFYAFCFVWFQRNGREIPFLKFHKNKSEFKCDVNIWLTKWRNRIFSNEIEWILMMRIMTKQK